MRVDVARMEEARYRLLDMELKLRYTEQQIRCIRACLAEQRASKAQYDILKSLDRQIQELGSRIHAIRQLHAALDSAREQYIACEKNARDPVHKPRPNGAIDKLRELFQPVDQAIQNELIDKIIKPLIVIGKREIS